MKELTKEQYQKILEKIALSVRACFMEGNIYYTPLICAEDIRDILKENSYEV